MAVLVNPANATNAEATLRELETAARATGLQIQLFKASSSREINAAFDAFLRDRPDAVLSALTPFQQPTGSIGPLGDAVRIPASYPARDFAEAGGLMSYGANIADAWRQAGVYAGASSRG